MNQDHSPQQGKDTWHRCSSHKHSLFSLSSRQMIFFLEEHYVSLAHPAPGGHSVKRVGSGGIGMSFYGALFCGRVQQTRNSGLRYPSQDILVVVPPRKRQHYCPDSYEVPNSWNIVVKENYAMCPCL